MPTIAGLLQTIDALKRPMGRSDFVSGVQRGGSSGLLGFPVDLVNMPLQALGVGSSEPVMGSRWIENKLTDAGLLTPRRGTSSETVGELASGLLNPATGVAVAGPRLYAAEQAALANAARGTPKISGGILSQSGQVSAEGLNKAGRAKRTVGTSGQYVGAPPGIDNPAKFNSLIDQYAKRIDEALSNGVERGYFYERGTAANKRVTDSPAAADRLAMLEGVTSSEAPVHTNTGWAIKAVEQDAMGAPVATGKYPNNIRTKVTNVLRDVFSHIGEKTHRYGAGLSGDVKGLAPNDRWEIRSFGYAGDSATPQQHAFMDEVRQRAVERWNAKHPEQKPLSVLEGQELNWATQRARDMGVPHTQAAADTIQDALKSHTIQHSWESAGGANAKHLLDLPAEQAQSYHDEIKNILLDTAGKDRLIRAMGGRLQLPAFDGPGVWNGVISPGTQSRSLGYMTQSAGLDPTTAARVNATEAARAFGLGQDAYSAHGFAAPPKISGPKTDTMNVVTGRTITPPEASNVGGLLRQTYGENATIVPTEEGFRVLRIGEDPKFASTFKGQIAPALPAGTEVQGGMRHGIFNTLGWGERNATRDLLEQFNNPAAPNLRSLADSPETRQIMGQLADVYEQKAALGLHPNDRLATALREWSKSGLLGLEELVKKGMAPAVFGYGLADQDRPTDLLGYR